MFNTVTPDRAMSEGSPRMMIIIFLVIILFGLIYVLAETKKDVVYYISPTEPLSSCHRNSSCPPGQLCHTMDYLVEHSSELFSSDHVNVTLMFMCGVHNYTKDLVVYDLHSFVMKGAAESSAQLFDSLMLAL